MLNTIERKPGREINKHLRLNRHWSSDFEIFAKCHLKEQNQNESLCELIKHYMEINTVFICTLSETSAARQTLCDTAIY